MGHKSNYILGREIAVINNSTVNAPHTGNTKVSENVNKLIEFEQKHGEISTENGVQNWMESNNTVLMVL